MSTLTKWFIKIILFMFFKGEEVYKTKFLLLETEREYALALWRKQKYRRLYASEKKKWEEKKRKERMLMSFPERELDERNSVFIPSVKSDGKSIWKIGESLMKEERNLIFMDGETIFSKISDREGFTYRKRFVVKFQGRYFLFLIEYHEKTRQKVPLELIWVPTGTSGTPQQVPAIEATGETYRPIILWVTDSLSQFKDEELRAIA